MPELSSPPNATSPLNSGSTNHLKPTGTSMTFALIDAATRSIREEETSVLPTAAPSGQPGRLPPNRYSTHTAM